MIVIIALLIVAACAAGVGAMAFVVALYVSWRCYFTLWPAKVAVEWIPDHAGEDAVEHTADNPVIVYSDEDVRRFRETLHGEDDSSYPEFADGEAGGVRVDGTFTIQGERIDLCATTAALLHGLQRAVDVPVPVAALQHCAPDGEIIEAEEASANVVP